MVPEARRQQAVTERTIALLRGINVGRGKRIAMADLRALLSGLGHADVATYLQSGNAVFTPSAASGDSVAIAAAIEAAATRDLGVHSRVVIRTAGELAAAIAADPFGDIATEPAAHLLGFLAGDPSPEGLRTLADLEVTPDQVRAVGRHLFLWCPAGILASPFATMDWEKLLGVPVTMRNWTTVTRLDALAAS